MAQVPRVSGSKLLVQIGDGASPEVFAHDCLINTSRGLVLTAETGEAVMPDCDNPLGPQWKEVFKTALSATISGAGMLYTASIPEWVDWWDGNTTKNVRFSIVVAGADGGGYLGGKFHLTQMEINADSQKETSTCNVTLVSSGALGWTDAA